MGISGFLYSLKQGIINIWRNKLFSTASVATMTACIFLFGLFYAIVTNFQSMVRNVENGVAITVFFDENIPQAQIEAIGKAIESRYEVASYDYISADEAWETYKMQYFDGDEEAAEGFGDDNPLAQAASYEVYLKDVSMQESLVSYLESLDGVREVNESRTVARMLTDFNRLIGYVSMGVILILFAVATFLISNTVAVGISVRREEIGIMKLIGATDVFVKAPFYVEGILIGLIGSLLPMAIFYVLYGRLIAFITEKFHFLNNLLTFLPVDRVFHSLLPIATVLGVGIGFLGSAFTVRRHLHV